MKTTDKSNLAILIREELKSRKLATILHDLGVEEQCPWLACLNDPIADCLEINSDAAYGEYDMIMEVFAQQTKTVEDISIIATRIAGELTAVRS